MECDDRDDPFSSLTALCHISHSQEDYLSSCPFAGNHDLVADSEPSLCTGCLSTPLSKYRNQPEASSMEASGVGQRNDGRNDDASVLDGGRVVDTGRDAELGFHPEVRFSPESEQSSGVKRSIFGNINGFVKEFCDSGPKKFEVCSGDTSAESSCKRLKISQQILASELASSSTGPTNEKTKEDLLKIHDSLKIIIEEMLVETKSVSKNTEGESTENKKLKASDNLESTNLKENETIQSVDTNENIKDIMDNSEQKRVENCNIDENTENTVRVGSTELQGTANSDKLSRILPPWSRKKKEAAEEVDSDYREITLLDVLKILKDEDEGRTGDEDNGLADMSILEILKSRGMTFPRPSWWPEGGFEGREKTKKKKRRSC